MKKNLKAQSATEFLIYTSIGLLILTVLVGAIAGKQQDVITMQTTTQAEDVAETISAELDTALIMGEGYEREMEIPNNLNGNNYQVNVDQGFVVLTWVDSIQDTEMSRVVPTKYDGDIPIDTEITRTYKIKHEEDGVEIEPVT